MNTAKNQKQVKCRSPCEQENEEVRESAQGKKDAKESNDPEELKKYQIESLDQEIAKTVYELWPQQNKQH